MALEFVNKPKQAFAAKTRATKKQHEHQVSLNAMAASSNNLMPNLKLERRCLDELKGMPKRARKSDKPQIERVAKSIQTHGQVVPILINEGGTIIDGHIVVQALRALGAIQVWCVIFDHLGEHDQQLLHVALNRLGETGDWDLEALGPLLLELEELEFDLSTTGFELAEIDIITSGNQGDGAAKENEIPDPPVQAVTLLGDLWQLGEHRILCGDATEIASYAAVLDGELAACIFTDCPWNIPIAGFVSGLGKVKHADFVEGAGEKTPEEFAAFSDIFHQHCAAHLVEGGVFFSCIDWRSTDVIMASGRKAGLRHIQTVVWNKGSGGMGSLYRSAHEFFVVFCKGKKIAANNVNLGKSGRDRTSVWTYPGANRRGSSANKALADHPTPKNVSLVADALLDVTRRGAIVVDCFLGSGTTVLAAQRTKRRARGIELDPRYVDVAIRRWEDMTGNQAIHLETGLTFKELGEMRAAAGEELAAD